MHERIIVSLIAAALVGCSQGEATRSEARPPNSPAMSATAGSAAKASLPDRDPQLAKKLVSEGGLLLDVRTQGEWDERHLDDAKLIPVGELEGRLSEIEKLTGGDKDKPIVVFCRSGHRAGQAKKMLLSAGYTQVTNLGGIDDWPTP